MSSKRFVLMGIMALCVVGLRASDSLEPILTPYLTIQKQLAADKTDGTQEAAREIAAAAGRLGERGKAIATAANAVARAGDLETAREAFGPLSDAVIAEAKAQQWAGAGDVKIAYCPMAKRSWLQIDEKIRNPYYGSGMLECGEFRDRGK